MGFGQEERVDGTQNTCSFTQVKGKCSLGKVLFVTDVATCVVKLAASLAGTVSLLKTLGSLYDSFGIHCRGEASEGCTIEKAKTKATAIRNCSQDETTVPLNECHKELCLTKHRMDFAAAAYQGDGSFNK